MALHMESITELSSGLPMPTTPAMPISSDPDLLKTTAWNGTKPT
jgi:hypothetical protein